jgi:hypothetical protein
MRQCWQKHDNENDPDIKSFSIKFEFFDPRTPQRNWKVERKFQTLYGRIGALLIGAGLKVELRDKIWAEWVIIYPISFQQNRALKAHSS